ncbi:MAG: 2-C-methyl-D-erythritol 2,4-cyclodiphosphate synthase [Coriobacteriia bacterium]|nr:2-C-methyl-D-erythritol 2,4-cyclodiphosphate synthase [Coriobacteriia bacterium]MCL2606203.1 2-C-methyl-D-erythritol 2,4-cyclodiphosphate synthase [Coriobacteriia bacterium]
MDMLRHLRIGTGYDVHAFAEGRPLILGGITVPHSRGLDGHSDADVLAHALTDALLGAARLENAHDIGQLFPDTDERFRGADSLLLLRTAASHVQRAGFSIVDADCILVAQAPKLSPYRDEMRSNLARTLSIDVSMIGLKATTTERLGFAGREEGIAAHSTVLLIRE